MQGSTEGTPRLQVRYRAPKGYKVKELLVVRDGERVKAYPNMKRWGYVEWKDEGAPSGDHSYYLRAIVENKAGGVEMMWTSPIFLTVK